nr:hypothetical protein [Bacteroidota bacterium]
MAPSKIKGFQPLSLVGAFLDGMLTAKPCYGTRNPDRVFEDEMVSDSWWIFQR